MIVDVVAGILLAGLTLYAALGGADFGGGLWDLLAGGYQRGRAPRQLIDDTITPVWEANHVWLIFVLVIFWTAFPPAFAAVMTAAALPLWLAAFGIVLRGAGFAFRKEVEALHWQRLFGCRLRLLLARRPVLHGHRDRRDRVGPGGGQSRAHRPGGVDRAHLTAHRRTVRRGMCLPRGRVPHPRGQPPADRSKLLWHTPNRLFGFADPPRPLRTDQSPRG